MFQIKKILDDLVDHTYKDSSKLEEYHRFYVEICKRDLKSKHGDYNGKTHRIRIFNLYRSDAAITATTIHELAHHIDHVNRGKSDHGKAFYAEYRKLLYMGLNMKLFTKSDFLSSTKDASDSNKVAEMIKEYRPVNVGYKAGCSRIAVSGCYEQREQLKERGYSWNKINKTWEKEIAGEEVPTEQDFLKNLGLTGSVTDAAGVTFDRKNYIVAGKGSYEIREELKAMGFRFTDAKKWRKEGTAEELEKLRKQYPDAEFKMAVG